MWRYWKKPWINLSCFCTHNFTIIIHFCCARILNIEFVNPWSIHHCGEEVNFFRLYWIFCIIRYCWSFQCQAFFGLFNHCILRFFNNLFYHYTGLLPFFWFRLFFLFLFFIIFFWSFLWVFFTSFFSSFSFFLLSFFLFLFLLLYPIKFSFRNKSSHSHRVIPINILLNILFNLNSITN